MFTHREQVTFAIQAFLSFTVIMFCIGMLAAHNDTSSYYLPILTSILGYWLPAPRYPGGVTVGMRGDDGESMNSTRGDIIMDAPLDGDVSTARTDRTATSPLEIPMVSTSTFDAPEVPVEHQTPSIPRVR